MIGTPTRERSKDSLLNQLDRYSDAGAAIVHIRTREPLRAATILRERYTTSGTPYHEWSASTGFRTFTSEDFVNHNKAGAMSDFMEAYERPRTELRSDTSEIRAKPDLVHIFCYVDPGPHLQNNPYALDLTQQYVVSLPVTNVAIFFITQDAPLDMLPTGTALVAELPTPSVEELEEVVSLIVESIEDGSNGEQFQDGIALDEEDINRIAVMGLGLTYAEFETHISLSVVNATKEGATQLTVDHLLEGVSRGKTEVVRESEILELTHPADINDVGGMARLKEWVGERATCYSEDAKAAGVEPPKGCVLVGVPGAGKSLVAKAISSVLGVPLVRLDFARVFSKYVGDSESRVRQALSMVEAMAPCVLFVDEIDKGLGGIGSGGDSGTGMRVLGTYLTWLQELNAPVFNMVTANRVNGLPPELLRRGRFDQVFSVALPSAAERKDILSIHLRKRGRKLSEFTDAQVQEFVKRSDRYVPAEIESAVKDALTSSFARKEKLRMEHLLTALKNMVPLSTSNAQQIESIVAWAAINAIPVAYPENQKEPNSALATADITRVRRIRPGSGKAAK